MDNKKWKELLKIDPNLYHLTKKSILYPTLKQQLAAVKQDGYNICYIRDPNLEVQLAAVKQDGNSIQYIEDPHSDVIRFYLSRCGGRVAELLSDPAYDLKE